MGRVLDTPRTEPLVEPLTGLTPWEVCRRLADQKHLHFFDSSQVSELGRYSYVTANPSCYLTSNRGWISEDGAFAGVADPLHVLAGRLAKFRLEPIDGLPPFQGGAAGLFSYDLCHHIEVLPRPTFADFAIPECALGIYDWVIAFDEARDQAWLISTGYPEIDSRRRLQRAAARAEQVRRLLEREQVRTTPKAESRAPVATPQVPVPHFPGLTSNFDRDAYLRTVARAIEYIRAGDCFQVNIAQRLMLPVPADALTVYDKLRTRNPAPFAGYFDLGDFAILSASPERFLRVQNGEVETRPIKGTRP
ncbi:MAG TPA: chorismate-binding protein, partial [Gemmataceae bacterium]|nr:chorismate-binding protein [Gemmataceae bacterium]